VSGGWRGEWQSVYGYDGVVWEVWEV
jgi:hypothetical protein